MKEKNNIDFFDLWNASILESFKNRFDKQQFFKSIKDFPNQIIKSFDIENKCYRKNSKKFNSIYKNIESILICGMGGSAIGAEFAKAVLLDNLKVPIFINKSDTIPAWVNDTTLVIISSYSGNTYETIDSFNKAKQKTGKIILISSKSKGILNEYFLDSDNYITVDIPSGLEPRCALGYMSATIILILARLELIDSPKKTKMHLKQSVLELNDIDKLNNYKCNPMIAISHRIKNMIPVIYGSENLTSVSALRFKNQLQENAKMIAFSNNFPEINHNEVEGWNSPFKNLFIIWLKDSFVNEKNCRGINSGFELLNNSNFKQEIISLKNKHTYKTNRIATLYKTIYFLDWVSYYSALLNNVDPSLINNIKYIKKTNH